MLHTLQAFHGSDPAGATKARMLPSGVVICIVPATLIQKACAIFGRSEVSLGVTAYPSPAVLCGNDMVIILGLETS